MIISILSHNHLILGIVIRSIKLVLDIERFLIIFVLMLFINTGLPNTTIVHIYKKTRKSRKNMNRKRNRLNNNKKKCRKPLWKREVKH